MYIYMYVNDYITDMLYIRRKSDNTDVANKFNSMADQENLFFFFFFWEGVGVRQWNIGEFCYIHRKFRDPTLDPLLKSDFVFVEVFILLVGFSNQKSHKQ